MRVMTLRMEPLVVKSEVLLFLEIVERLKAVTKGMMRSLTKAVEAGGRVLIAILGLAGVVVRLINSMVCVISPVAMPVVLSFMVHIAMVAMVGLIVMDRFAVGPLTGVVVHTVAILVMVVVVPVIIGSGYSHAQSNREILHFDVSFIY